jgi:hypothetical protein
MVNVALSRAVEVLAAMAEIWNVPLVVYVAVNVSDATLLKAVGALKLPPPSRCFTNPSAV